MTAPARQVFTLLRGMVEVDRAAAAAYERSAADPGGSDAGPVVVRSGDPDRAEKLRAFASHTGEVG